MTGSPAIGRVLLTGANGFIGRALREALIQHNWQVREVMRSARGLSESHSDVVVKTLHPSTDWRPALEGCSAVIHLAALVHVRPERTVDSSENFRLINTAATLTLAQQAAELGIKRFLFTSSAKVTGESSGSRPFREDDPPHPEDAYAISKWEAEVGLRRIAQETGLRVTIVRPPLVYGPGVGANFLRLLRWVSRGIPLPLASVKNRRSLVFLGNLADALLNCLQQEAASGKTFFVSDIETFSTPELIEALATAMGRAPGLWSCPPSWLGIGANLLGLGPEMARLTQSLEVDSSSIRTALGWKPPYSASSGLARTVEWFRQAHPSETRSPSG